MSHLWGWPQYVMAVVYINFVAASISRLAFKQQEPVEKLFGFAVYNTFIAAVVYTLHAGGFW